MKSQRVRLAQIRSFRRTHWTSSHVGAHFNLIPPQWVDYNTNNTAKWLDGVEKKIRALHKEYRKSHIKRLNEGRCSVISGVLFLDLLSNLERVGDHTINIAETIV